MRLVHTEVITSHPTHPGQQPDGTCCFSVSGTTAGAAGGKTAGPHGGVMGSRGRLRGKPRMGKTRPQREMGYRFGTAGLVEADQVKSKVLDPVERPRADRPVLDALGPWLEPRHQPVGVYLALMDDRYPPPTTTSRPS